MHATIKEGLRLRSIQMGKKPFVFRNERRIPLNTLTILWTSITVPGNPGAILGVLIGTRHEEGNLYLCEDPKSVDAIGQMYALIAKDIDEKAKNREWIQIAVGTRSDAKALASLVEASGNFGPDKPWEKTRPNGKVWHTPMVARARMLGSVLANPVIIRPSTHNQASLIVLTEELAEHYATPISDQERANLGVHLAWLREKSLNNKEMEAVKAFENSNDHRPLGELDEKITNAIKHLKETRDNKPLQEIVRETIKKLRLLQEEAYDFLINIPDGSSSKWFHEKEKNAHEGALRSIRNSLTIMSDAINKKEPLMHTTNYLAGSRKSDARVKRFLRQEHAFERDNMQMIRIDDVLRAGARIEGEVLVGKINTCMETPSKRTEWIIEIQSNQSILALDENDNIEILDKSIEGKILKISPIENEWIFQVSCKAFPGEVNEVIEIAKSLPYGNIGEAIKRRIGRDRTIEIDRDGGADPEDEKPKGFTRTSRFGGPSWTHDEKIILNKKVEKNITTNTRVENLLALYSK